MQRSLGILAGMVLVVVAGCSDYDVRLQETLEEMQWKKKLDDNLAPPSEKGQLKDELIYVRQPKTLTGPTQTFGLTVEPGKFDVENSFIDQAKGTSLHVLARHKKPKPAATNKKTTAAPAEATPRGDFAADVLEVVKSAYGVEVPPGQLKSETKKRKGRSNAYRITRQDLGAKEVQVYIYGNKNDAYEVALIFEGPKEELRNLFSRIDYCLQSFAVGDFARRAFAGVSEYDAGDEGGGAPPPI
jgi:hypothetical protein